MADSAVVRVHPVWFWLGGLVLLIGVLVTAAIRDPLGNARETLGALGLILLGVCVYLIPAVIAHQHRHPNAQAITVLNLFGGWTVLGWVAALVWAYTKPAR